MSTTTYFFQFLNLKVTRAGKDRYKKEKQKQVNQKKAFFRKTGYYNLTNYGNIKIKN